MAVLVFFSLNHDIAPKTLDYLADDSDSLKNCSFVGGIKTSHSRFFERLPYSPKTLSSSTTLCNPLISAAYRGKTIVGAFTPDPIMLPPFRTNITIHLLQILETLDTASDPGTCS